jgi:hypothetical protein
MDKVRMVRHRAFHTLAGLVEAVELEGIGEFNVVRRGGVWYLTCAAWPAPDVAVLLNRIIPRIDAGGPNPIDPDIHCCEWTLHIERERIHAEFADALAAHRKQEV